MKVLYNKSYGSLEFSTIFENYFFKKYAPDADKHPVFFDVVDQQYINIHDIHTKKKSIDLTYDPLKNYSLILTDSIESVDDDTDILTGYSIFINSIKNYDDIVKMQIENERYYNDNPDEKKELYVRKKHDDIIYSFYLSETKDMRKNEILINEILSFGIDKASVDDSCIFGIAEIDDKYDFIITKPDYCEIVKKVAPYDLIVTDLLNFIWKSESFDDSKCVDNDNQFKSKLTHDLLYKKINMSSLKQW